jgi:Arc/MetJ-type ribon-helix-helix transcriptional regulator
MSYEVPADVEKLIEHHMALGGYASPEDVLRDALDALGQFAHSATERDAEYRETVAAVREGLADAEAGRMRLLRDFIADTRRAPNSESL